MLCLKLRQFESVMIGNVCVKVMDVNRGRVKIAINAPPELHIDRFDAKGHCMNPHATADKTALQPLTE